MAWHGFVRSAGGCGRSGGGAGMTHVDERMVLERMGVLWAMHGTGAGVYHPPAPPRTVTEEDRVTRSAGMALDDQEDKIRRAYAAGYKAGWRGAVEWYSEERA